MNEVPSTDRPGGGRTAGAFLTLLVAFALALAGSSATASVAAPPAVPEAVRATAGSAPGSPLATAGRQVWVTLEEAMLRRLQRTAIPWSRPLAAEASHGGIAAVPMAEGDLPQLSTWMHEATGRCGGFRTHETLEDAVAALHPPLESYSVAAVSYQIGNGDLVRAVQGELRSANILATIEDLSTGFVNRYYNTASGRSAALSIRDRWQALAAGRSGVTVSTFNHSGWIQPSVIVEIQGSDLANEVVVLGAHLDSKVNGGTGSSTPAPGADDDASGIAALTEVLRAALAVGFQPRRTVKIMGYAAEEVGLRGSAEIAQDHLNRGIDVVGVLQLDMVAFNGSAEDVFLITDHTNSAQNDFLGDLLDTYQSELTWSTTACGYSCSDHASWQSRGFPASFPFEARFQQHNLQIHTANDTVATFGNQAEHALKFAKLAAAYVVELAAESGGGPAPVPCPSILLSPAPGSTLSGASETFSWEACDGGLQYWVYVGSSQGANDLLTQDRGTATSVTVGGLPTDGSAVWVRLWSRTASGWQNRDFSYTAADEGGGGEACPAELVAPVPGSTLGGTSTTLQWTSCSSATAFWIYLGTSSGGRQILSQSVGTATSLPVSGLPAGRRIYVRVWSRIGGSWSFTDTSFFTP